jgi:hypothetical protein
MKYTLYSLLLVLLVSSVYAAEDFNAELTTVRDVIYPDEVAFFQLTVTNLQQESDVFAISTQEYDWILDSEPLGEILPGQTRSVLVELAPKGTMAPGTRAVIIKVRSANTRDFEEISKIITVRSLNGSNRTYAPSVFLNSRVAEQVDPREAMTIEVYLRNRNARVYDKLDVHIESDIFTKDYSTSLGPIGEEGEKTNTVSVALKENTPPGVHPLKVTISVDGQRINTYETQYTIKAIDSTDVQETAETVFFKTVTTYTVANNGNIRDEQIIFHPTNPLKRLFTDASADYDVQKNDEGSVLVLNVNLEPQQEAEITVTENYRLLFILGVLVLLSIISYYVLRSPVVLHKEATIIGSSADGVSHIKVRLFIKNRSAKAVHNLHVIDKVTSMADVVKESSLGTLQPSKIVRKKGHGTLVRWDIDTLEAFEERIITYQVRTQLKLIGDVYLPAMKVKFDQGGRERTTYSNEVNIPREG